MGSLKKTSFMLDEDTRKAVEDISRRLDLPKYRAVAVIIDDVLLKTSNTTVENVVTGEGGEEESFNVQMSDDTREKMANLRDVFLTRNRKKILKSAIWWYANNQGKT